MTRWMARQGDVLLIAVGRIPKSKSVPTEAGRVILAHGEVTGHAHAIGDPDVAELLETGDGARFLRVTHEAELRHEEHDTVTIPPGRYRVIRQREYSPEEIRNVAD